MIKSRTRFLAETRKVIILASKSPRRSELLQNIFRNLLVVPSLFDEDSIQICSPDEYVKLLSYSKANSVAVKHPSDWVIGADTIVEIDGEIIGKPHNTHEAVTTLSRLSGKEHKVYTGYTILSKNKVETITRSVSTSVEFKGINLKEIKNYVSTGEPFDKSGGYAIQGIGSFIVKRIVGSYTNVMGLPMCELIEDLIDLNIIKLKD